MSTYSIEFFLLQFFLYIYIYHLVIFPHDVALSAVPSAQALSGAASAQCLVALSGGLSRALDTGVERTRLHNVIVPNCTDDVWVVM